MIGNEAVARGLYEAGVGVVSSYPGTPSTEITEFEAKYDEVYCEWAPNEKVAMETAFGASLAGALPAALLRKLFGAFLIIAGGLTLTKRDKSCAPFGVFHKEWNNNR